MSTTIIYMYKIPALLCICLFGIISVSSTMGWLGKIDKWITKKQDARPSQGRDPFNKRRKDLATIEFRCNRCGHHKCFTKKGVVKCTKCGLKRRVT